MLCDVCSNFLPCDHGEENHVYLFSHHTSVQALVRAAHGGCDLCRALESLLEDSSLLVHWSHDARPRWGDVDTPLKPETPTTREGTVIARQASDGTTTFEGRMCNHARIHTAYCDPDLASLFDDAAPLPPTSLITTLRDLALGEDSGQQSGDDNLPDTDGAGLREESSDTPQEQAKIVSLRFDGNTAYIAEESGAYTPFWRSRERDTTTGLGFEPTRAVLSSKSAMKENERQLPTAPAEITETAKEESFNPQDERRQQQEQIQHQTSRMTTIRTPNETLLDLSSHPEWQESVGNEQFSSHQMLVQAASSTPSRFGSEQIWLCVETYTKLAPGSTGAMLSFNVGSISAEYLTRAAESAYTFCWRGESFEDVAKLVLRIPDLWRYKRRHLVRYNADVDNVEEVRFQLCLPPRHEDESLDEALALELTTDREVARHWWRELPSDPICDERFALIRTYLKHCDVSHSSCAHSTTDKAPSRLLDLRASENASSQIQLVVTSPNTTTYQYAALSHCWGTAPALVSKLTTANEEDYKRGLKVSSLSPNFRDAIGVAVALEIRYIWIDALCILQDSKSDWAFEAPRMGSYYRGAYITISGLCSKGAGEGMLHPLDPGIPTGVFWKQTGQQLSVRRGLEQVALLKRSASGSGVPDDPSPYALDTRGWTFQERLFSRRLLHFTNDQMVWQCEERLFAEGGEFMASPAVHERHSMNAGLIELISSGKCGGPTQLWALKYAWPALVQEYTKRSLTYATDILPAVSAIVQGLAEILAVPYVSGHWLVTGTDSASQRAFIKSLLWRPAAPSAHAWSSGSPSWSWSSICGGVDFLEMLNDNAHVIMPAIDPELVKYTSIPQLSENQFGQTTQATLVLRGMGRKYHGASTYWPRVRPFQSRTASGERDNVSADRFVDFDIFPGDDYWTTTNATHILFYMATLKSQFRGSTFQCFLLLRWLGREGNSTRAVRVGRAYTNYDHEVPVTEEEEWHYVEIILE